MTARDWCWSVLLLGCLALVGCSSSPSSTPGKSAKDSEAVLAQRARLSAEDQALVAAQEWCVIATTERLGAMGAPVKLLLQGEPVFLCCAGCQRQAEADPGKTLARLKELKEKAALEKAAK